MKQTRSIKLTKNFKENHLVPIDYQTVAYYTRVETEAKRKTSQFFQLQA